MKPFAPNIPVPLAALALPPGASRAGIVDANDEFLRLWGCRSRDELVGATLDAPWAAEIAGAAARRHLEAGRTWRRLVQHRRSDGELRDLEVVAARVPDGDDPETVIATFVDVTERLNTERALRDSERRFRNLAANVPGAIFRYVLHADGSDRVTYMSPGCIDIWELPADHVVRDASPLWAMVDARDVDDLRRSVLESAETLRPWLFEWRVTTPSGRRKWLQGSGRPGRLADGDVAWDSLILDITALKEAEAASRLSEARLGSFFAESPAGMAIFDRDGRYARVNPTLARMNGVPAEQHIGRKPSEIFAPELAAGIEAAAREILATGRPDVHREVSGETPAAPGELRHWLFSQFPITDQAGSTAGVGVVVLETTALKRAEAARAELETKLLQAQRLESIGRLAGGIAHDFNNLLTVILANAEEAEAEAAPGSAQAERLQEVRAAARRSAELTRQLLAFARRQVVSPQVLAVDGEVQKMLDLLRRLIGAHVELEWRPGAPDGRIEVDPGQFAQVLTNLVVNARDAVGESGHVTVETAVVELDERLSAQCSPGSYVRLSVADDGGGMDDETQARMFEPFFTTKGGGRGTGLGLATVHGIVMQNRGCIDVRSEEGRGTTFDVYLPRHAGAATPSPAPSTPPAGAASGTVLLVEDELPVLSLARRILEQLGYTVLATTSAHEAVALGASVDRRVDLLVTDLVMPDLSGKEVAVRLTALRPDLKVLFLSGYFQDFASSPGVRGEGVTFLSKPFTAADLEAKVREALGG